MKRRHTFIIFAISLLPLFHGYAQEIDYTQYYLNLPGVNPGFTGMEDFLDTKAAFRQGWNDFNVKNNYTFLSVNGILNKSTQPTIRSNSLRTSNPGAFNKIKSDKKLLRRHGLGGMLTDRTIGPYKAFSLTANYAYHVPLSGSVRMSFGARLGVASQRINPAGFTVRDDVHDDFYQQIMRSSQGNDKSFLLDFGYVIYADNFYAGLSSSNLVSTKFSGTGLVEIEQVKRYTLQTALTYIPLSENLALNAGARLIYASNFPMLWAVNARLKYKGFVYMGTGYASQGSKLSFLLGLNLKGGFSVNYAYDKYMLGLNNFNIHVHEVVLGAALFNKFNTKPRLW